MFRTPPKIISFLFLIIFFPRINYAQEIFLEKSLSKFNFGDSLSWKSTEYSDNSWEILFGNRINYESENLWIRTKFYSNNGDSLLNKQQVIIEITGTYEAYWNGYYLGNNCITGSDIKLGNGIYSKNFMLPDSLIFNENILALRIYINDGKDINISDLYIENADFEFRRELYGYGFLIVLVLLHLLFLFLFIANPLKFSKLQVNYFSVLLISILLILVYEICLLQALITYHHFFLIGAIEFYQNILLLIGLTIFYFEEYNVKNNFIFIFSTALLIVFFNYFDVADAYLYLVGFFPPICLLIFATIKREDAALQSLIFLLIIFSILYAWYVFSLNDISFIIFSTFFIIRKIRLDAEITRKLHEAELRAARLETEMLKKIIQPHYIMNSLNVALEFIEESPKRSIRFIKELSDEFRAFMTYSNKQLITIKEEITLCRKHLKIMEYRQLKKYSLQTNIINMNHTIPPAIFHTLIENGVTYNLSNSDSICFMILEQLIKNGKEYQITVNYNGDCTNLSTEEENKIKKQFNSSTKIVEGTGIKYIKSRLTESYGARWKLIFFGNETIWVTKIEIYDELQK